MSCLVYRIALPTVPNPRDRQNATAKALAVVLSTVVFWVEGETLPSPLVFCGFLDKTRRCWIAKRSQKIQALIQGKSSAWSYCYSAWCGWRLCWALGLCLHTSIEIRREQGWPGGRPSGPNKEMGMREKWEDCRWLTSALQTGMPSSHSLPSTQVFSQSSSDQ